MSYSSEAAKVRELEHVMKYVKGRVCDIGAGHDKITHNAYAIDGRSLPGVDCIQDGLYITIQGKFDTIFSSHFLEHVIEPTGYIYNWYTNLNIGGHLILYLPQKGAYNSHENPEHMWNWDYEDFIFWIKRSFCGDGKNYKGENIIKIFELIDSGLDIGHDRYSFFVILRRV